MFDDKKQIKEYKIDKQMCLIKKDYELRGDFYSKEFMYVEIRLFKCQGLKCKDNQTIDSYFENLDFSFAFINS
jgi:hypothetical protein